MMAKSHNYWRNFDCSIKFSKILFYIQTKEWTTKLVPGVVALLTFSLSNCLLFLPFCVSFCLFLCLLRVYILSLSLSIVCLSSLSIVCLSKSLLEEVGYMQRWQGSCDVFSPLWSLQEKKLFCHYLMHCFRLLHQTYLQIPQEDWLGTLQSSPAEHCS